MVAACRFVSMAVGLALFALLPASVRSAESPAVPTESQPLKPDLEFPTREAYEAEIKEPGILLQNGHLLLFAPQRKKKEAAIIFDYLVKAYEELYKIVGTHTKYKLVVYHLPKGWGGTGDCVIEYDYSNLDSDKWEKWRNRRVPHVSGYIEEMAHNFVSTTKAQFGWEMVGWSVGVKVTRRVADSPCWRQQVLETRWQQAETYARYKALHDSFPPDLEPNLCDRIHAFLLWQCEQKYGEKFWADFFREVRSQRDALEAAVHMPGDDAIRNERYRITVDCFDRLPKLKFKKLLEANAISTTVDAKSLHPTRPGWDRRFVPPSEPQQ